MTMVGVDRSRAARIGLALLATLALLAVVFSTAMARPVLATHESTIDRGSLPLVSADKECEEAGFDFVFKLDDLDVVAEGIYTFASGDFSGTIKLIDSDHDGEVDDYVLISADPDPDEIIVKQPNVGGGISHITFCFNTETAPVTGDLMINKTDGANALPGVVFTLTGASLTTPLTDTTDAAGKANFDDLAPGSYTLTEATPAGFNPAGPWAVTVSATGVVTIAGLTAGTDGSFTIVNSTTPPPPPVTGDLAINKTNGATALAGVTFTLSGGGLSTPLTDITDAAGKASFENLAPGTYNLAEATPAGFNAAGPWTVTVSATGVVTIAGLTAGTDGSFTIVNSSGGQLGSTGSPAPTVTPVRSGTLTSTGVPNTAVSTDALGSIMLLLAAIALIASVGVHTVLRLQGEPRKR